MRLTLKSRRIGNSVGVIIPKKLGVNAGETLPSTVHNGHLDINFQNILARKRGEIINECFRNLDKALNERQMTARFKKEGW